jgi:CelD/BcsL family acetyltransferase involved in cellulose biosynthesis
VRADPASGTRQKLRVEVVDDVDALGPHEKAWDDLAVEAGKPYCSPLWMIPWWRHVRPPAARLQVVLAFDGPEVVGVAPLFADRGFGGVTRYRILGAGTSSRVDLLARADREADVARVVATAIADARPAADVVMFEGTPAESRWPALIRDAWAARRRVAIRRQFSLPAPTLDLASRPYDRWFMDQGKHFRGHMRRALRRLADQGGAVRLSADGELPADLNAFARLHYDRWTGRGGSGVLDRRVEGMLGDVATRSGAGRLRVWCIDLGGETISAQIFLVAGGEVTYWLGGFDERWSRLQPAITTVWSAVKDAFEAGDRRLDLGSGGQDFKYRFADGEDTLDWVLLVSAGPRAPFARMQLLRLRTRLALARHLPPRAKNALKGIGRRIGVLR